LKPYRYVKVMVAGTGSEPTYEGLKPASRKKNSPRL